MLGKYIFKSQIKLVESKTIIAQMKNILDRQNKCCKKIVNLKTTIQKINMTHRETKLLKNEQF